MAIEVMQDIHETQPSTFRSEGNSISAIDLDPSRDTEPPIQKLSLGDLLYAVDGQAARNRAVSHFLESGTNHVSIKGFIGYYEAMLDPLNVGTPLQRDALLEVESQILRMDSLKGTRGRNTFTDKRAVGRLEKVRDWMNVEALTTVIGFPKQPLQRKQTVDVENPYAGKSSSKPLVGDSSIANAGRIAAAAGIIAMPAAGLDSPQKQNQIYLPLLTESQPSNQDVITIDKSALDAQMLDILSTNFDPNSLNVTDAGLTQRITFGGVTYDVQLTPADIHALNEMQHTLQQTDTAERHTIYLSLVGRAMKKDWSDQKPTAATATATNTAEKPPITATPGATDTPVTPVIPTVAPSETPPATATNEPPTPEPTEQGPLKEIDVPRGALIGVVQGTDSKDMPFFLNGNDEAERILGLEIKKISYAVFDDDENLVVGTVPLPSSILGAPNIDTTVTMSIDQVPEYQRPNLETANPASDDRFHAKTGVWFGSRGETLASYIDANGPRNFPITKFGGSLDGTKVIFSGYAQGNADSSDIIMYNDDPDQKLGTNLILRYDIKKRSWGLLAEQTGVLGSQQSTKRPTNPENTEANSEVFLHDFGPGERNLEFVVYDDGIVVTGKEKILIPIRSGQSAISASRLGPPRSAATLFVNRLIFEMQDTIKEAPREIPESQLPSTSSLGKYHNIETAGAFTWLGTSDNKSLELFQRTGLIIPSSTLDDGSFEERHLQDRELQASLLLGAEDKDTDIVSKINANPPGSTYIFGARGTGSGPVGDVFSALGRLNRSETLIKAIDAARKMKSRIIIDSGLLLDLDTSGVRGESRSPMKNAIEAISQLNANDIVTLTFNADWENYRTAKIQKAQRAYALTIALKQMKDAGLRPGLMHIMGNEGDEKYFEDIAIALMDVGGGFAAFGSLDQRYLNPEGALGFFNIPGPRNLNQERKDEIIFSPGAIKFRDALIGRIHGQ